MYCPNCGQQLEDDLRFCWKCGTDIHNVKPTFSKTDINPERALYHCPLCGRGDKVEKVSAIVAKDTVSGTTQAWASDKNGGHWSTVPYTQVSKRALNLAAPTKPQYSPSCLWICLPFIINPLALAWFAPISKRMKVALAVMILFVCSIALVIGTIMSISYGSFEDLPAFLGISSFLLFPVSYVVYFLGLHEETKSRKTQIEATELPKWQQAIEKWNELYYCDRDDCVFDPATKISARSDKMMQMLYSYG